MHPIPHGQPYRFLKGPVGLVGEDHIIPAAVLKVKHIFQQKQPQVQNQGKTLRHIGLEYGLLRCNKHMGEAEKRLLSQLYHYISRFCKLL
ncbi:hypothetical protein D3C75_862080 [compost metagenome]